MDKKYIATLLLLPLFLLSAAAYAERPAVEVESEEPASIEANAVESEDMRPAADDTPSSAAEVDTETRSTGDVLEMAPAEAVPEPVRQLDFPRRGMTQEKVQNELGRPLEIIPAVGEPPITRWVYEDRVVYFEYSAVIHVVAK